MDLLLRIVGILALAVVLGLAALVAFLWWHWRRIKRALGAGLPPLQIALVPDPAPDWTGRAPFAAVIDEFRALGFTSVGPFEIEGIAGARLLGFCHPGSGIFGGCYNHPAAGCFVDVCATLEDGLELTVTNAPAGGEMDTRPGTEKVFRAGQPLAALHAALLEKIAGRAVRPCPTERFQEEFVAAYARDMEWRTNRLGISEAEFRRVAANQKKPCTEEQLIAAFRETKLQELRQWTEEAAEEFARTASLSVSRWKEFEDALLIYRDDFHPTAYLEYLAESVELPCPARAALHAELEAGTPVDRLREKVADATGRRLVPLGSVARPVRCTLYGIEPDPATR